MCLVLSLGPMGGAAPEFYFLASLSLPLVVTRWAGGRGKTLAQLDAISQSLGRDFPLLGRGVSDARMNRVLRLFSMPCLLPAFTKCSCMQEAKTQVTPKGASLWRAASPEPRSCARWPTCLGGRLVAGRFPGAPSLCALACLLGTHTSLYAHMDLLSYGM